MKILSINLWFDKYGQKTIAELKSFAHFGYETFAATIRPADGVYKVIVYRVEDRVTTEILSKDFKAKPAGLSYLDAFKYLFKYAADNNYDIVYMRRLMSKIMYAAPYLGSLSKKASIVYEIPTYPFDIPANMLYGMRDKLELAALKRVSKYISVTSACVYQNAKVPTDWLTFENGLNISNFTETPVPELNDTISMLMIANMASWHRSERILHAIKNYSGPYKLHLVVASAESKEYSDMKELAKEMGISDSIDFLNFMPLPEINELAKNIHLAVGQLSGSEYGVMETHALKHKDYCALGLPTFSTCTDSSFMGDYPYYYFIEDTDADIDLDSIIKWYEEIHKDSDYRSKMFKYAEDNLQFHSYVKNILDRL